jgi:hypothetical protein
MMNSGAGSRRHERPPILDHFIRYLRVPYTLAAQWWRALGQARWSEASALRQSFLLHVSVPFDTRGLVHKTASPQALVHVLTMLEKENLLAHRTMNRIMEFIVHCTDKDG